MGDVIKKLMLLILSEHCYDTFFVEFNFFDGPCLKATVSKCLGIGIIAGSMMVKVPQITKIVNNRTAEGISFLSVVLDLFAITANVAYNVNKGFSFDTWGEGFFLLVQTAIIGALVLHYSRTTQAAAVFLALYLVSLYVLIGGLTPDDVLWFLQAMVVPIVCVSKLIQAYTNYRNQSTGQLSAVTCFLLFGGSLARVFTTIQETGDSILFLTFLCATVLNGLIAGQVLWYWNVSKPKKE